MRIKDYGVTEERYIGIVASIWIIAWSLVFTWRRKTGIRWIPVSLAVIAIAIAFGPWSAGAVSQRSQIARVIAMLQAEGLWHGNTARPAGHKVQLSNATGTSLRSTIDYLIHMHGARSVQQLFASVPLRERWYREPHWNAANAIMDGLDLAVAPGDQWVTYRRVGGAIDVTGFRKVWPVLSLYSGGEAKWSPQRFGELQIGFDHNVLKMALGNSAPEPIPLDELLRDLPAAPNAELSDEQSRVDFTQQNRTFRVVLTSLQLRPRTSGPVPLTIQCVLLER